IPPTLTVHIQYFSTNPSTTKIYPLSLHDALPISYRAPSWRRKRRPISHVLCGRRSAAERSEPVGARARRLQGEGIDPVRGLRPRSEEHTSELQSRFDLVCRLLLEKKKKKTERTRK